MSHVPNSVFYFLSSAASVSALHLAGVGIQIRWSENCYRISTKQQIVKMLVNQSRSLFVLWQQQPNTSEDWVFLALRPTRLQVRKWSNYREVWTAHACYEKVDKKKREKRKMLQLAYKFIVAKRKHSCALVDCWLQQSQQTLNSPDSVWGVQIQSHPILVVSLQRGRPCTVLTVKFFPDSFCGSWVL